LDYKSSHIVDCEEWTVLPERFIDYLEENPPNLLEVQKELFKLSAPNYEYPHLEKCSPNCKAEETNIMLKNMIDKIKTIEPFIMQSPPDIDEAIAILEEIRMVLYINRSRKQKIKTLEA